MFFIILSKIHFFLLLLIPVKCFYRSAMKLNKPYIYWFYRCLVIGMWLDCEMNTIFIRLYGFSSFFFSSFFHVIRCQPSSILFQVAFFPMDDTMKSILHCILPLFYSFSPPFSDSRYLFFLDSIFRFLSALHPILRFPTLFFPFLPSAYLFFISHIFVSFINV